MFTVNQLTSSNSVGAPSRINYCANYSTHTKYKIQNTIFSVHSIISLYIT